MTIICPVPIPLIDEEEYQEEINNLINFIIIKTSKNCFENLLNDKINNAVWFQKHQEKINNFINRLFNFYQDLSDADTEDEEPNYIDEDYQLQLSVDNYFEDY